MPTKTFNISLPDSLLEDADAVARTEYRSRSELIREALRTYIERSKRWERLFSIGDEKARELGITSEDELLNSVS